MSKLPRENSLWVRHPYVCFSFFFAACALAIFGVFPLEGMSLLRIGDSYVQHFPAMVTYARWLRSSLFNLVRFGELPALWSGSIGYGADIITTFHHYGLGDPLMLFSALFSASNMEYFYSFLVVFRMYLAGLAALLFFRSKGSASAPAILGALAYCLSGYVLTPGIFHPFFTNPMIYFPLLLWSADRLYIHKQKRFFIISVFLAAVSSIYFFYMLVILVILYVILEYFVLHLPLTWRDCFSWIWRFLWAGLLSCALAAPILLPCGYSLLISDRAGVAREWLILYPDNFYENYFAGLFSNHGTYYFYVAISAPVIFGVFWTITAPRKKYIPEKISLIVLSVFSLLPFFGAVLNGFSYPTNRWIWAFCLLLAWCFVRIISDISSFSWRHFIRSAVLFCACAFLFIQWRSITVDILVPLILCFLCWPIMALSKNRKKIQKASRIVIYVLTVFSTCMNGVFQFNPAFANGIESHLSAGTIYDSYAIPAMEFISKQDPSEVSRFETAGINQRANTAILYGLYGTDYYFSLPNASSFQRAQYLNRICPQRFSQLEKRSFLDSFLGVRYYAVPKGEEERLPFGYDSLLDVVQDTAIYTSSNALPLVFAVDSVISGENLSPIERQQAILQAAITNNTSLPACDPQWSHHEIYFTEEDNGASRVGNSFLVSERNGSAHLQFDPVSDAELYVVLSGLQFSGSETVTTCKITISAGDSVVPMTFATPLDNFYTGYTDYAVCLGYFKSPCSEINLAFRVEGTYTFEDFKVVAMKTDALSNLASERQNSGIRQIKYEGGNICFSSDRSLPGIAVATVPYSSGWHALLDGQPVEVLDVDDGFCGVFLAEGSHQVEMRYTTPLLIPGCIISLFVGLSLAVFFIRKRRV